MKQALIRALAVAAAIGSAAAAGAQTKPPAAKPAARDWATVVAVTPDGGFRMGNPAAPVKLVEYGSLTCPHCAQFTNSAKGPLTAQVRTGKVSFEFRNLVLNGVDLGASLLARCAGPRGFFPLLNQIFATQKQWIGKITSLSDAQTKELEALPDEQRMARMVEIAGLTQMAARGGVPPQRAKACLADKAGVNRLMQMQQAASALGVQSTPTFLVNGKKVHAHDWAELLPEIRQAGG